MRASAQGAALLLDFGSRAVQRLDFGCRQQVVDNDGRGDGRGLAL
ncbi:hypothetical protein [Sphingomonas sp. Leaf33]|nr:hypothetical protein [Sphingomonas sp. Leaf33]